MDNGGKNGDDLCFLPVSRLSEMRATGKISTAEITEAYLSRIAKFDSKLNAYVEVYAKEARLAATSLDAGRDTRNDGGLACGIPIALKDLLEVDGKITTAGSAHFRGRRSCVTASLARRLISSGSIILGKTQTVEFAYSGWGINPQMGTPWNPWDEDIQRIPGGSSSGSAVAVSGSLAPWAIGTDTGGSVRLPASFCGVTALKTTADQIATDGIIPLSKTFDTPGPITRSVLDAAILYNVMLGSESQFAFGSGTVIGISRALEGGVLGLKLGSLPKAEREGVEADVLEAYDRSLETLSNLGAEIVETNLPFRFQDCFGPHMSIVNSEAYAYFRDVIDDGSSLLDESVREGISAGRTISPQQYSDAFEQISRFKAQISGALVNVDALLTPTTLSVALPVEGLDRSRPPSRFTRFVNTLGMCGLALPNGKNAEDLPTSLQIVCREHQERLALRIGLAFQQATSWHLRRPTMFLDADSNSQGVRQLDRRVRN
ncbi:amidase [Phyllobacterium endophyticum]|uniref:Indoleacetamide hydrolase n=1 Tax=Phyllobacterium endophyticum TaxID=1149773 RepID=A0A2P7AKD9_9HYPH|nr:amidase [Phyllobacterium endophyticum]MBB3237102.1 aspartyl-tRNA(Asn)/glutamyl-tRNA(Gln) amidotransferase subunit A [Phyllobacterium endophyticum]PSH54662.1 amidase [Phyllobacterium endophyticum]TYR40570.1 amidase [Phyllobacterium endophyticum]